MEIKDAYLILADISGYTPFVKMHRASILHAEEIVTELMEAIIDAAGPPLILNKLEGDAAFLYAPAAARNNPDSQLIFAQVRGFFQAFKARQQALIKAGEGGCFCEACCNIEALQLKVILHYGQVVIKHVHHHEELAGRDVILTHRLLKNSLGIHEYVLTTEDFYSLVSSTGNADKPETHWENYDDLGSVKVRVFPPQSSSLEIPATRRFTNPKGIWEGLRLFARNFGRRWRGVKPNFANLVTD
jgi:Protein of unknown function (DUF2652)